MELMASCFDKLLKLIQQPIPEHVLSKLTFCVRNKNFAIDQTIKIHVDISFLLDGYSVELFKRNPWNHSSR